MESAIKRISMIKKHIQGKHVNGEEKPVAKVHLEKKYDIKAAIITWDSPHTLNALHPDTIRPMNTYLREILTDENINSVILTGEGIAFCAGANIKQFDTTYKGPVGQNESLIGEWMNVLKSYPKPVIAAVNGYWFGGGLEVALMCDIMIASEEASFGMPEIKLGLIPGAGGTQALIKSVGKSKAMEMILTGKPITAMDAYEHNLVARVVPHDELMTYACKEAKRIGKMSQVAIATAKKAVNFSLESTLSAGIEFERGVFNALFGTNDAKEGISAFIEKRKPKWTNS